MRDNLYMRSEPIQLKPGTWYALCVEKKSCDDGVALVSNPPQYHGYWVYTFEELKTKGDLLKLSKEHNVVSIFKVSDSHPIAKKYKTITKEVEEKEFDGYKIDKPEITWGDVWNG